MENNVFISTIKISDLKKEDSQKMTIYYYDKQGEQDKFTSSIMKSADMEKYKKDIFKVLNCKNLTQMMHNPILEDCTIVYDDKLVVGLKLRKGFITKSNVDFF